jgi:hypothetical protein
MCFKPWAGVFKDSWPNSCHLAHVPSIVFIVSRFLCFKLKLILHALRVDKCLQTQQTLTFSCLHPEWRSAGFHGMGEPQSGHQQHIVSVDEPWGSAYAFETCSSTR